MLAAGRALSTPHGTLVPWRLTGNSCGSNHEHQISVEEANEALADGDSLLYDPDPKSKSGRSARVIGYSPTAVAVLVVILVHREDKPGAWWGANGWRANSTDRRTYRERTQL